MQFPDAYRKSCDEILNFVAGCNSWTALPHTGNHISSPQSLTPIFNANTVFLSNMFCFLCL